MAAMTSVANDLFSNFLAFYEDNRDRPTVQTLVKELRYGFLHYSCSFMGFLSFIIKVILDAAKITQIYCDCLNSFKGLPQLFSY